MSMHGSLMQGGQVSVPGTGEPGAEPGLLTYTVGEGKTGITPAVLICHQDSIQWLRLKMICKSSVFDMEDQGHPLVIISVEQI